MKKVTFSVLFPCMLLLCFLSSVSYAFMKGLSTEELTDASDTIIEGDVENTEAQWSKDGKTIITNAEILINTVIKGKPVQNSIKVEYTGGEVGEIGLKVSDQVTFKKGEKVLLFLRSGQSQKDSSVFSLVGKGQGKYVIDSKGIAKKSGFSIVGERGMIDNNIPSTTLIDKVKRRVK
jgi:hypothetical protein